MADETIRRGSERSSSINRRGSTSSSRSRPIASNLLDRNDGTFTSMAPSGTPGITSDRLSNLASLLQSKPANNSESQSQIVLDDSNTTPRLPIVSQSLENHINDSDVKSDLKHRIQDSDNERPSREGRTRLTKSNDNETQQPTPPQSKITRKSRHRDANRRFTLDCQDEKVEGVGATLIFRITNWATDSSVTLRLRNIPEFTQNVADRPED